MIKIYIIICMCIKMIILPTCRVSAQPLHMYLIFDRSLYRGNRVFFTTGVDMFLAWLFGLHTYLDITCLVFVCHDRIIHLFQHCTDGLILWSFQLMQSMFVSVAQLQTAQTHVFQVFLMSPALYYAELHTVYSCDWIVSKLLYSAVEFEHQQLFTTGSV